MQERTLNLRARRRWSSALPLSLPAIYLLLPLATWRGEYEPTRETLRAVLPYLSEGSVLAFDQLGHAKWPGETAALRDIRDSGRSRLTLFPGRVTPAYLRWGSQ